MKRAPCVLYHLCVLMCWDFSHFFSFDRVSSSCSSFLSYTNFIVTRHNVGIPCDTCHITMYTIPYPSVSFTLYHMLLTKITGRQSKNYYKIAITNSRHEASILVTGMYCWLWNCKYDYGSTIKIFSRHLLMMGELNLNQNQLR